MKLKLIIKTVQIPQQIQTLLTLVLNNQFK